MAAGYFLHFSAQHRLELAFCLLCKFNSFLLLQTMISVFLLMACKNAVKQSLGVSFVAVYW
ncbi:CLUMA_CG006737, isoform A [Clunio marinus]|uniref:CLUMA_CG006737, isoform A n=1 Tax=Clunio marinus TaxID=568069 RepID=A0A1J1I487_9DIPT|nr:CLUMA_CG006737, isoform A [Clunio marinus]